MYRTRFVHCIIIKITWPFVQVLNEHFLVTPLFWLSLIWKESLQWLAKETGERPLRLDSEQILGETDQRSLPNFVTISMHSHIESLPDEDSFYSWSLQFKVSGGEIFTPNNQISGQTWTLKKGSCRSTRVKQLTIPHPGALQANGLSLSGDIWPTENLKINWKITTKIM
jgi:hypothetical protein